MRVMKILVRIHRMADPLELTHRMNDENAIIRILDHKWSGNNKSRRNLS